jgi:hypothetical protein
MGFFYVRCVDNINPELKLDNNDARHLEDT